MLWIDFPRLWIVCCLKLVEHLAACSFNFICVWNLFWDWSSLMQKNCIIWF
jgi:hypothetical protein